MARNQKLELQWIGKDQRPRLEPRILLEDPELSYHAAHRVGLNDRFDNRLIFGDNLLALKALEQEFTGKIKCIYIDPPYNTGSAFAEYDDGVEHSLWLTMMRDRFQLLQRLLADSGSLWVHLDDNEMHYAKVVLDDIFGRGNFVGHVVWQKTYSVRSNAQFFSVSHEHILVFAKDATKFRLNPMPRSAEQAKRFKNPDDDPRGPWQSVTMTISLQGGARGRQYAKTGQSDNIYDVTSPSGKVFSPPSGRCWSRKKSSFDELDADRRIYWGPKGDSVPRLKMFLSEQDDGQIPTTLWADGPIYGFNQDGIRELRELGLANMFPTPKPERLIHTILSVATEPGDWVLDSFLGSGTTAAVAHKMKRRWIGVELGDHAESVCVPRLVRVIDGEQGGISADCHWKGGGGFRYFKLAPSLIEKDKWGNPVINRDYNADMLAEAVCKLEGFTYAPTDIYWQQGYSTERDFIYVTTQKLTRDQLQSLSDEVGDDRTLLVCCAAFRAKADAFANLTIKKIPHAVLSRCEWGRDDYSLQIKNLPAAPDLGVADTEPPAKSAKGNAKKSASDDSLSLFDTAPTK